MVLAAAANHSGISSNVIANANANLAKGDVAAAAGDPSTAIKDYKAAWASTCRVCAPAVSSPSEGKVKITFNGVAGLSYLVQACTDLKTWTTLGTVSLPSNGNCSGSYTDSHAGQYPGRFYRVVCAQ